MVLLNPSDETWYQVLPLVSFSTRNAELRLDSHVDSNNSINFVL